MELLINSLLSVDRISLLFTLFLLLWSIALTVLHHIWKKKAAKNSPEEPALRQCMFIWRLLCLVPLPLAVLHSIFFHFRGSWELSLALYGSLYFVSILLALWQFLAHRKYGYRVAAACVNLFAILGLLMFFSVHSALYTKVHNFTNQSYTESFRSILRTMQREYVLSEWKNIDYDALEKDIMPMVEEAEETQDSIAYGVALMNYTYRFYDGHVCVDALDDEVTDALCERLAGNDYGFSLATLDDGSTIAVLTDPGSAAYELGIHDGSIITRWDGSSIADAVQDVSCIYPEILTFPVAENESYIKPLFLAGKGGKEIEITFLDENGNEKTASLKSMGSYRTRLELALSRFYHSDIEDENFSCKMLTDACGYLRINAENCGFPYDTMASLQGEYHQITEILDKKLQTLCDNGMKTLIIDLRGNEGGSDFMSPSIASLFSKEEFFCHTFARYKDGAYIPLKTEVKVAANGAYADIPTAVLVNAQCCSSGDGLAENLSRLPNITLMGITSSNGICQTTGGYCFTTDSEYAIAYPYLLDLDENGEPRIDTRADRINRIPLKRHIPLTKESALAIFSGEGDYELEYAMDFLKQGH